MKYNEKGVPFIVSGRFDLGVGATKGGAGEETAVRRFLNENKDLFRMSDAHSELKTRSNETDQYGLRTIRFTQQYKEIPVYGGDLVASLDRDGRLTSVNGNYLPDISVTTVPRVSAEEALAIAKAVLGIADENVRTIIGPELMIYPKDGVYHLAWCLTLVTSKPFAEWKCFVDAHAGALIDKWNDAKYADVMLTGTGVLGESLNLHGWSMNYTFCYWLDILYFGSPWYDLYGVGANGNSLIDTSKSMYNPATQIGYIDTRNLLGGDVLSGYFPTRMCVTSVTTNYNSIYYGFMARSDFSGHHHAGMIYDYLKEHFGRNSIDGNGMNMVINVDCMFGSDATNAMWSRGVAGLEQGATFFGGGDGATARSQSGSLSCVTHEFTHGVTNYTSNLEYKNQSGAINEGFSDSFAYALEAGLGFPNPERYNGEGCWLASPGYCRNLQDPHQGYNPNPYSFGAWPATMDEYQNVPESQDNGGVHINQCIISHCFYLICQAIGVAKGEQIWYKTQTQKCTTTTNFTQLRELALSACSDLGYGIGSGEYSAVMNAFASIGIGGMDGGGGGGGGAGTVYHAGDALTVTVTVPAISGSAIFDGYSVALLPSGGVMAVWNNAVTPYKAPIATRVPGFSGGTYTLLSTTIPPGTQPGTYTFVVALIYTGQNPRNYKTSPSTAVWYAERAVNIQ
ncbi:MAG: M4 family metallopeptidase [Candidatus Aureabacteria bacterium]|nr:M4 family metallopeptidase [Candidatus Auribacterota bacterium]